MGNAETTMVARVLVTLKTGVLDPAGQAIADALQQLGFKEVRGVRLGKVVEIEIDGDLIGPEASARSRVAEMAEQLLSNPVIEDFEVELEGNGKDP